MSLLFVKNMKWYDVLCMEVDDTAYSDEYIIFVVVSMLARRLDTFS